MSKRLKLSIVLEEDNEAIALVDIDGCTHYMCDEPDEEKEHYQNMCVKDFIADYVAYYNSAQEGEVEQKHQRKPHYYVIRIRDKYYFTIDQFVDEIRDAVIFEYPRAVYVKESLIFEHHDVEDCIGFSFNDDEIKIEQYNPSKVLRPLELTYLEIALQLCDGLHKTDEEIHQAEKWLMEYGTANDLSLQELNEMCREDSTWFLDEIFG